MIKPRCDKEMLISVTQMLYDAHAILSLNSKIEMVNVSVRRPILSLPKTNNALPFRSAATDNVNVNRPKMLLPKGKPVDTTNDKTR